MNKKLLIGLGTIGVGTAVAVPVAVVLTKHDKVDNSNGSNINPKASIHNKTGHEGIPADWEELTKATKIAVELTSEEKAKLKAQLDKDIETITNFEQKAYNKQVLIEKPILAQLDVEKAQLAEQQETNKHVDELIDKDIKTITDFESAAYNAQKAIETKMYAAEDAKIAAAKEAKALIAAKVDYHLQTESQLDDSEPYIQKTIDVTDFDKYNDKPYLKYHSLKTSADVIAATNDIKEYNAKMARFNSLFNTGDKSTEPTDGWKKQIEFLKGHTGTLSDSEINGIKAAWAENLKNYGTFEDHSTQLQTSFDFMNTKKFYESRNSEFPIYFQASLIKGHGYVGGSLTDSGVRELVDKIMDKMPMGRATDLVRNGLIIAGKDASYSSEYKNDSMIFHYNSDADEDAQVDSFIKWLQKQVQTDSEVYVGLEKTFSTDGIEFKPRTLHFELPGDSVHHFTVEQESQKESLKEVATPRQMFDPIYVGGKITGFNPYQVIDVVMPWDYVNEYDLKRTIKIHAYDKYMFEKDLHTFVDGSINYEIKSLNPNDEYTGMALYSKAGLSGVALAAGYKTGYQS